MNRRLIGKDIAKEFTPQTLLTRLRQSMRSLWTLSMEFRELWHVAEIPQRRCRLLMSPCSGTTPSTWPTTLSIWISSRPWEMPEILMICQTMRLCPTCQPPQFTTSLREKLEISCHLMMLRMELPPVSAPNSPGDQDIAQPSCTLLRVPPQFVPPSENSVTETFTLYPSIVIVGKEGPLASVRP